MYVNFKGEQKRKETRRDQLPGNLTRVSAKNIKVCFFSIELDAVFFINFEQPYYKLYICTCSILYNYDLQYYTNQEIICPDHHHAIILRIFINLFLG